MCACEKSGYIYALFFYQVIYIHINLEHILISSVQIQLCISHVGFLLTSTVRNQPSPCLPSSLGFRLGTRHLHLHPVCMLASFFTLLSWHHKDLMVVLHTSCPTALLGLWLPLTVGSLLLPTWTISSCLLGHWPPFSGALMLRHAPHPLQLWHPVLGCPHMGTPSFCLCFNTPGPAVLCVNTLPPHSGSDFPHQVVPWVDVFLIQLDCASYARTSLSMDVAPS